MLTVDVQSGAAGGEGGEFLRAAYQFGNLPGGAKQLLEIIEDQQRTLVVQSVEQDVEQCPLRGISHTQRGGNCRQDEAGIGKRAERTIEDTVCEVRRRLRRDLQPKPSFTRTARSGQGHEADAGGPDQRGEFGELFSTAHEGGRRYWKASRRTEAWQRRKLARHPVDRYLEQMLFGREVFELMPAKVT